MKENTWKKDINEKCLTCKFSYHDDTYDIRKGECREKSPDENGNGFFVIDLMEDWCGKHQLSKHSEDRAFNMGIKSINHPLEPTIPNNKTGLLIHEIDDDGNGNEISKSHNILLVKNVFFEDTKGSKSKFITTIWRSVKRNLSVKEISDICHDYENGERDKRILGLKYDTSAQSIHTCLSGKYDNKIEAYRKNLIEPEPVIEAVLIESEAVAESKPEPVLVESIIESVAEPKPIKIKKKKIKLTNELAYKMFLDVVINKMKWPEYEKKYEASETTYKAIKKGERNFRVLDYAISIRMPDDKYQELLRICKTCERNTMNEGQSDWRNKNAEEV